MRAPLPPDEPARLAALRNYAVMDTPPDPDFDDIATLAAQICDMPIALITLIDEERQWFKAKVGMDLSETPREVAFCAHAINRPRELLVVNDATKDERFADNPYVTEENGIRFYAGAPLVTPGGHALGTLCVVDRKPRELSAGQREALAVLSRHVMTQLQLRRQLRERQRIEQALAVSEERWQFALEGSDQGVWDWDVPSNAVYFSPRWCAQLGHTPDEVPHRLEEWSSRVHPDDLPATLRLIQDHFEGRTPIYVAEFRMRAKDGTWRWIADRGKVMTRDAAGKPLRVVGTHIDITERRGLEDKLRRSEASLSRAQQVAHIGSWETDLVTMEVTWSEETHRIFGTSPATFQPNHESFLERVHPEDRARVHEAFLASLPADEARVIEHRICLPDGTVKQVEERWRAFSDEQGRPMRAVGTCQDITERRQLEEERKKLIHDLGERLKEVRALHQVAALLSHGGGLTPAVLERLVGLLPPAMQYPELAAARIVLGDLVQETPGYPAGTPSRLEAAIDGGQGLTGRIEVTYRETVPAAEEGPFLAEERRLVESVAEMLSTHARRVAAEQALAETLERNRDLIRSIEGIVWEADAATLAFKFVSEQAQRLLGYSVQEWQQHADFWVQHIHPEDRKTVVALCRQATDRREGHVLEYRMMAADGRAVWMRDLVSYVEPPEGPAVLRGLMVDITPIKQAQENLRKKDSLLRIAGRMARVGGWSIELPDRQVIWSDEMHDLLGFPRGQVPSLAQGLALYPEPWRAQVVAAVEACTVTGTPFDLEVEIDTAAGRRIWVRLAGEAERRPDGSIVRVHGTFQDITDRKMADAEIRSLAKRLTATLESITDAFYTLDRNWRFAYINAEAERVLQRSRDELLGRNVWELFPAAVGTRFEHSYRRAMTDDVTVAFTEHYPAPLDRWFEVRVYPSAEGLAVYFRDITEDRRRAQILRESEERYALAAHASQAALWDWDMTTDAIYFTDRYREILGGYTKEEFPDTLAGFYSKVHADDKAVVKQAIADHVATRRPQPSAVEFRILAKSGDYKWVHTSAQAVWDAQGRPVRMVGSTVDITEQKKAMEQMRVSEERFRLLSKATQDAIWDWDLVTGNFWWSEGLEVLFGYHPAELPPVVEAWSERVHPDDRETTEQGVYRPSNRARNAGPGSIGFSGRTAPTPMCSTAATSSAMPPARRCG